MLILALAGVVPGILLAISVLRDFEFSEESAGYGFVDNDKTVFYSPPKRVYVVLFLLTVPLYCALLIVLTPKQLLSYSKQTTNSLDVFTQAVEKSLTNKDEISVWEFSNPDSRFVCLFSCEREEVNIFVSLPRSVLDDRNAGSRASKLYSAIEKLGITIESDASQSKMPVLVLEVSGSPAQVALRCRALLQLKEMDYLAPDYWNK